MEDRKTALDLAMEASRLVWWDWDLLADHLEVHGSGPRFLGESDPDMPKIAGGPCLPAHPRR